MTAVAAGIARIWLATAAMERWFGRGGGQFSTLVTAMAATRGGRRRGEKRGARRRGNAAAKKRGAKKRGARRRGNAGRRNAGRRIWAKKTPAGRPGFEQLKKEEPLVSSVQKVSY